MASHMVLLRDVRRIVLGTGIVCLCAVAAGAQQPPDTPPEEAETTVAEDDASQPDPAPAEADAPQPVPILVADIPARAQEVNANVRRIETLVQPQQAVETIASALGEQTTHIVELRTVLNAIDPSRASVERIEDQRVEWGELEETFGGWMTVLQGRWTELQSERTELRDTQRLWTLSRTHAVADEAQPEVLQRIDTILSSLAQAEANVQGRSDVLGGMIDRVARSNEVVFESFDRLDAMAGTARQRVLTRDAEPFWRGLAVPDAQLFLQDVQQERVYWLNTLREFVEERQGRFTVLGGLFVILLIAAVALRRWSRTWPWPEDDVLKAARHVASRPVSTALALTLVSAGFVVPRAVGPLTDVVAILALVPIFRLGVGLAAPHIRRSMYGVTGLLALYLLTTFAPDGSSLRRLLMLVVTAASIVGATWLIRRWRYTDIVSTSHTARVGLVGLQLATGLLGVAFVANMLGWFALSQLLLEATVFSAYTAVAWRVVSLALSALVPIAPHSLVGRALPSIVRYESIFIRRTTVLIATVAVLVWTRSALVRFRLYDGLWDQLELAMAFTISAGGSSCPSDGSCWR